MCVQITKYKRDMFCYYEFPILPMSALTTAWVGGGGGGGGGGGAEFLISFRSYPLTLLNRTALSPINHRMQTRTVARDSEHSVETP